MRLFTLFSLFFFFTLSARPQYQLAICTIFQDEAPYLKEWIDYHRLVGVEHFFLYNNKSQDDYLTILTPYIKENILTLKNLGKRPSSISEWHRIQKNCYNKAIEQTKGKTKWLAVIDADEFLVPLTFSTLPPILQEYENDQIGGVYLNWLNFGTSDLPSLQKGDLMIQSLIRCKATPEIFGKSIVRPERVKKNLGPHTFLYKKNWFHVNTEKKKFDNIPPTTLHNFLIHHYYTRDLHHLLTVKYLRRKYCRGNVSPEQYAKSLEGLNAIENRTMERFWPHLIEKNKR